MGLRTKVKIGTAIMTAFALGFLSSSFHINYEKTQEQERQSRMFEAAQRKIERQSRIDPKVRGLCKLLKESETSIHSMEGKKIRAYGAILQSEKTGIVYVANYVDSGPDGEPNKKIDNWDYLDLKVYRDPVVAGFQLWRAYEDHGLDKLSASPSLKGESDTVIVDKKVKTFAALPEGQKIAFLSGYMNDVQMTMKTMLEKRG